MTALSSAARQRKRAGSDSSSEEVLARQRARLARLELQFDDALAHANTAATGAGHRANGRARDAAAGPGDVDLETAAGAKPLDRALRPGRGQRGQQVDD